MIKSKVFILLIVIALAALVQAALPVSGSVIHLEADALDLANGSSYSGEVSRNVTITTLAGDIAGTHGVDF